MPCAKGGKIGWLDKVRFIKHYATDGCSTTLRVYVETGVAADTNLVLGVVNTSPEDFVRFLLRPKGGRSQRHGIKGLSKGEAAAEDELFPDTAKLAADTIHEVTGWHVPTWGELGNAFYELVKPAEQVAYWLLLANVTTDFAFDWYSGILLSPKSKCNLGRFAFLGSNPVVTGFPTTNFRPSIPIFPPQGALNSLYGVDLFTGDWCVIVTFDLLNDPFHPTGGTVRCALAYGAPPVDQCGAVAVLDFTAADAVKTKKFVRKITAPETISLDISLHLDAVTGGEFNVEFLLEAFRL